LQIHSCLAILSIGLLFTFRVSRRRRKMYCGHACLCVCASVCDVSVCVSVHGGYD